MPPPPFFLRLSVFFRSFWPGNKHKPVAHTHTRTATPLFGGKAEDKRTHTHTLMRAFDYNLSPFQLVQQTVRMKRGGGFSGGVGGGFPP